MNVFQSRRIWFSAAVLAASFALLPSYFHSERNLETATRVEGSDAQKVTHELATRFDSPYVDEVMFVIEGLPAANTAEGIQALAVIVDGLKERTGIAGVTSYLDLHDPIFLGTGGGTFVVVGLRATDRSVESLIPGLQEYAQTLTAQLAPRYPGASVKVTGELPLNSDIRRASADEVHRSEALAVPATLVLLLLAFGSVVASVIPLAIGELAIATTLGIAGLLAARLHLSILVQDLTTMLGLGLGIDYTLLMVSRFREALANGHDGLSASRLASKQAGRTIAISACTVGIGFMALLTVPISEIRSIGVAGCLVAATSVLLTNTLVPEVTGLLAARIDWGRLPFTRPGYTTQSESSGRRWRRGGRIILAHPWLSLLFAGAPLLVLAWQGTQMDTGLPKGDWLPKAADSVQALHELQDMDRVGVVQSLRLVVNLPGNSILESDSGWAAINRASRKIADDPRCQRVVSMTTLTDGDRSFLPSMTRELRRAFVSTDGEAALIEVIPKTSVSLRGQVDWVRELRKSGASELTGEPSASLLVGGIPALNADYQTIVDQRLWPVTATVVVGTLLALFAGFRSIIVAIKAIALNLLSVAASFGALVLVFQKGHGGGLLGFPGGTGGIFPLVPIVTFAIVFGLSMDYEVFFVARVLEARRSGMDEREAIPEAMARTSGLITSAAAIMIVVFAAFTFGDFLVVKMIGFTLSVAVFIDATLVRMVIGPALLCLAGDWNWWPRKIEPYKH